MATPAPRQFRLHDDTMATIDALVTHLGLTSRVDVIRMAVKRLADAELPSSVKAEQTPKKISRKKK